MTSSSAWRAPPPAHTSGRCDGRSIASGLRGGRRTTAGGASGTSAASRSAGTPTYAGPPRVASASRIPSSPNCATVTGANIAAWSAHSCSELRVTPSRRRGLGTSVAMTTTRERLAHASPVAPSVFAAPGPVVTSATPGSPVARA